MNAQQWTLIAINVVGGILVLGSYVQGLMAHPDNRNALWGGVPNSVQPLYTVSMILAALGYFAFTYFVMFKIDAAEFRVADRFGLLDDLRLRLVVGASRALVAVRAALIEHELRQVEVLLLAGRFVGGQIGDDLLTHQRHIAGNHQRAVGW